MTIELGQSEPVPQEEQVRWENAHSVLQDLFTLGDNENLLKDSIPGLNEEMIRQIKTELNDKIRTLGGLDDIEEILTNGTKNGRPTIALAKEKTRKMDLDWLDEDLRWK